jgi:hypothetical protein
MAVAYLDPPEGRAGPDVDDVMRPMRLAIDYPHATGKTGVRDRYQERRRMDPEIRKRRSGPITVHR